MKRRAFRAPPALAEAAIPDSRPISTAHPRPGPRRRAAALAASARFTRCCCRASPAAARPRSTCTRSPTLRARQQALYLVPEIGLTPQLEAQVRARFPGAADLAGAQPPARGRARRRPGSPRSRGARASCWARASPCSLPFARLGLIVVDEEHDPSSSSRKDCAIRHAMSPCGARRRSAFRSCSARATPSLESYAQRGAGALRVRGTAARATRRRHDAGGAHHRPRTTAPRKASRPRSPRPCARAWSVASRASSS